MSIDLSTAIESVTFDGTNHAEVQALVNRACREALRRDETMEEMEELLPDSRIPQVFSDGFHPLVTDQDGESELRPLRPGDIGYRFKFGMYWAHVVFLSENA